jgi:hypothetical protein
MEWGGTEKVVIERSTKLDERPTANPSPRRADGEGSVPIIRRREAALTENQTEQAHRNPRGTHARFCHSIKLAEAAEGLRITRKRSVAGVTPTTGRWFR